MSSFSVGKYHRFAVAPSLVAGQGHVTSLRREDVRGGGGVDITALVFS